MGRFFVVNWFLSKKGFLIIFCCCFLFFREVQVLVGIYLFYLFFGFFGFICWVFVCYLFFFFLIIVVVIIDAIIIVIVVNGVCVWYVDVGIVAAFSTVIIIVMELLFPALS